MEQKIMSSSLDLEEENMTKEPSAMTDPLTTMTTGGDNNNNNNDDDDGPMNEEDPN